VAESIAIILPQTSQTVQYQGIMLFILVAESIAIILPQPSQTA
jgi:hypothetical protein